MKLVYLSRTLSGGGAEKVSAILASNHARQKHEVHLIVFADIQSPYELEQEVKLHTLPKGFFKKLFELRKIIKNINPNYLISLGSKYHYLMLGNFFKEYKVILSERNYPPEFYKNWAVKKFISICYRYATGVVFQTKEVQAMYAPIMKGQSTVILNPISQNLPEWKGNQSKVIIAFGRLEEQKNWPLLLESFAIFTKENPLFRLRIYGNGSQKKLLQELINSLGLAKKVSILSFTNNIHEILSYTRFFVSTSDYEGMPNSLLEALSMGVPSISTDSLGGSAKFLIGNNERGLLARRGEPEEIAEYMKIISASGELAQNFSLASKKLRIEFSEERISQEWIDFFTKLL